MEPFFCLLVGRSQRKEFAGAPCDCCGTTEDVEDGSMCIDCGSLYCKVCHKQHLARDLSGQIVRLAPCLKCHSDMVTVPEMVQSWRSSSTNRPVIHV
jgi:hypothetical protein